MQLNEKAEEAGGSRSSVCSALGYRSADPRRGSTWDVITDISSPKPSACSSHSACPFLQQLLCLWFYLLPWQCGLWYSSFPRVTRGVGFARESTAITFCVCSCSAAPAPQGRHPGHEYIQDIWINENISSLEPNVNQALLKSIEIKYLPVLKELIQTCSLLDPKRFLSRS